jgi:addiction module HigA family antidote
MAKTIKNGMRPVHPGEVLSEELMKPMGLSSNRLAEALGVPANRVSTIVAGKRDVTADTALRLARFFGSSPTFWMNLQAAYDLRTAEIASGKEIAKIRPFTNAGTEKRTA